MPEYPSEFLQREKTIRDYKLNQFGERFAGACLSKLEVGQDAQGKIVGYTNKPRGIMLYHGNPGIGKTYLCAALTDWSFERFHTRRYHKEENLLRKLRHAISEGNTDYAIELEYLIDDDLVMLDDVGSGIDPKKNSDKNYEWRCEVFYTFLDYRYRIRKPTIITSNFSREDFEKIYPPRVISRLFSSENTIIDGFNTIDKRTIGY